MEFRLAARFKNADLPLSKLAGLRLAGEGDSRGTNLLTIFTWVLRSGIVREGVTIGHMSL